MNSFLQQRYVSAHTHKILVYSLAFKLTQCQESMLWGHENKDPSQDIFVNNVVFYMIGMMFYTESQQFQY